MKVKCLNGLFKIILIVLVVGIPLMGCVATGEKSAPEIPSQASPVSSPTPQASPVMNSEPSAAMVSSLQKTLSKQTGIPANQLKMVESTQKTWSDGCLGLGKPEELCSQAMVQGWQITFSNGTQRWVYRTNSTGNVSRLEPIAQPTQPKG
jgi:hypothetical protein